MTHPTKYCDTCAGTPRRALYLWGACVLWHCWPCLRRYYGVKTVRGLKKWSGQ